MAKKAKTPKAGDLQVWHIPQIPGKAFRFDVKDPREAAVLLRALALYDIFQFENRIKPDYSNAAGLEVFEVGENAPEGEWCEWYDDEGQNIDEVANELLKEAA